MSEINALDVKELRQMTNSPMMECKKALVEALGDKQKAIIILKEKGLDVAAKRSGKEAKEGMIVSAISDDGKKAVLIKANCETDFVAKSEPFQKAIQQIAKQLLSQGNTYLLSAAFQDLVNETSAKTGERVLIADNSVIHESNTFLYDYVHSNRKIGVLIAIEAHDATYKNPHLQAFGRNIAMQVAAMSPIALNEQNVSDATRNEQKNIFLKQMQDDNKPDAIKEKIVEGKLKKYFSQTCLMEMAFVKDPKHTINDLQADASKEVGTALTIRDYKRFEIA